MFLKNVVDEVFNHDFVMQSSIGSKTKHFHTIDHLRPLTWFCGDCQMWPNQQICHMPQFWIQHQFRLEVYQIFFKKLIHHLQSIIFHIHHLFSFWVWVVQNGPEVQKSSGQAGIDSVLSTYRGGWLTLPPPYFYLSKKFFAQANSPTPGDLSNKSLSQYGGG